MTYGSFLCAPQIHLEQEVPFNLYKDNDNYTGKFALQKLFQIHEVALRYILETSGTCVQKVPIGLMRHISTEHYFFQDFPSKNWFWGKLQLCIIFGQIC